MQKHTEDEIEQAILEAVNDINMEHAIETEPHHSLVEMLSNKTVTALRDLAKLHKVRGYTGMNKQALTQALISRLTDSVVLKTCLILLDELEWDLFKQTIEVKCLTPDKLFIDSYRMMLKLGIMGLYYHGKIFCCVISDEIKDTYAKLKHVGFAEEKEHGILLHKYAMAATHLYGVISQVDFVGLFNSQNDRKTNIDEVFAALMKYVSMDCGYVFWEEYIVNDDLEQNDYKDVGRYVKSASRHPRYVPPKEQLLRYADWNYFDETPYTRKLREYMNTHLPVNADITEEIIEEISYISSTDIKFQAIFSIFDRHGIEFKNQRQVEQFMPVLVNMYNNSRQWLNNGHTPIELRESYSVNPMHGAKGTDKQFTFSIRKEATDGLQRKVGRNEPCPCGSGKKYKKCCGSS